MSATPGPASGSDAELVALTRAMVGAGTATAAAAAIVERAGAARLGWAGWLRLPRGGAGGRPLQADSRFDLASLSKPVWASVALRLDAAGSLPLATRLGGVWPEAAPALAERTLEDLLRHRAGFRPWAPLGLLCGDRGAVAALLLDGSLLGAAEGTYSDLDYVLWGLTVERALETGLAELAALELEPLGDGAPLPAGAGARAATCRIDGSREVDLAAEQGLVIPAAAPPPPGLPQDGNARFLGGLAGHAGLFADLRGMIRFAGEWLRPGGWLPADGARRAVAGAGPYLLGWARPATWRGDGGELPPSAFGHLGFTGGSLWIDAERGRAALLLAHRSAPSAEIDPWRRRLTSLSFAP